MRILLFALMIFFFIDAIYAKKNKKKPKKIQEQNNHTEQQLESNQTILQKPAFKDVFGQCTVFFGRKYQQAWIGFSMISQIIRSAFRLSISTSYQVYNILDLSYYEAMKGNKQGWAVLGISTLLGLFFSYKAIGLCYRFLKFIFQKIKGCRKAFQRKKEEQTLKQD